VDATQTLEESPVNNYVFPRGMKYSYRRRIPADLLEHFKPKTELTKALGTSDRREADRLGRALAVKHDEEFTAIRAVLNGQQSTSSQQSTEANKRQMSSNDDAVPSVGDVQGVASRVLARLRQERERAIAAGTLEEFLERQRFELSADKCELEGKGLNLFPAWKHEAFLIARQQFLEPGRHPAILAPSHAQPLLHTQTVAPASNESEPVSLEQLMKLWENDRNPSNARTVLRADRVVREFARLQGNLTVQAIARKHCFAFRDALREEGQTIPNTNIYTNMLSALFSVACNRALINDNPAKGLSLKDPTPKIMKRKPFTLDALIKVFGSAVYTEGKRTVGGAGEAAYWLPLLALFTGARLEELGQLTPHDIREEAYEDNSGENVHVWVISITYEGEGQSLKNEGSRRRIPIHAELIRLGFIEFAQSRQSKPRIFFELKADPQGRETGPWSKWFGRWLRDPCNVTDTKIVFHSFRHTFKDWCRDAGIEQQWHDKLTGHAGNGSVGDNYGSEQYSLKQLALAMQKIRPPMGLKKVLDALPICRA
jgi:integrase